jgi:hypothetical protein
LSLEWWGLIRYGVYGSPVICHYREPIIPEVLAVTSGLWNPGYFTPIVVPEPSTERAVKNVLSTRGRIGAHMLLRALLRDLVCMLWGQSLHDLDQEYCGGAHRVTLEATSEVKAQAEAKFHMYCLV